MKQNMLEPESGQYSTARHEVTIVPKRVRYRLPNLPLPSKSLLITLFGTMWWFCAWPMLCRGGGEGGRTSGLCVNSFLPACKVWVDSDIFEYSTLNITYTIVARSHSIIQGWEGRLESLISRTHFSQSGNQLNILPDSSCGFLMPIFFPRPSDARA